MFEHWPDRGHQEEDTNNADPFQHLNGLSERKHRNPVAVKEEVGFVKKKKRHQIHQKRRNQRSESIPFMKARSMRSSRRGKSGECALCSCKFKQLLETEAFYSVVSD